MKKKVFVFALFLLTIVFTVPSFATYFEIQDFSIDAYVLSNGDMEVTETISYSTNEIVNGLTRNIEAINPRNEKNSADSVTLKGVYVDNEPYEKVSFAEKGESGVYTETTSLKRSRYQII